VCILCGEFVSQHHWTDRHIEDKARAANTTGSWDSYRRYRRRDRYHRVKVANEVLRHYSLKVQDWSGSKYLLSDRKGRTELVQDLGSLWPAAQKLANRPLDPLDPALHAALNEATTNGG